MFVITPPPLPPRLYIFLFFGVVCFQLWVVVKKKEKGAYKTVSDAPHLPLTLLPLALYNKSQDVRRPENCIAATVTIAHPRKCWNKRRRKKKREKETSFGRRMNHVLTPHLLLYDFSLQRWWECDELLFSLDALVQSRELYTQHSNSSAPNESSLRNFWLFLTTIARIFTESCARFTPSRKKPTYGGALPHSFIHRSFVRL